MALLVYLVRLNMSVQPKSQSGPLTVPEFRSTIPAHLLGKLSDSDRYMVETMSKLENQSQWLVDVAVQGYKDIAVLEEKVRVLETWKEQANKKVEFMEPAAKEAQDKVAKLWDWHKVLSGKWAVLWAILLIFISVVLKFLLDHISKKGP